MTALPRPDFTHLLDLSGPYGTFEHAELTTPRVEHGYCTDDVARVLLVLVREGDVGPALADLARTSLDFLALAQHSSGRFRNRRLASGQWRGPATSEDCWGRAMWAIGTTVARSTESELRAVASELFARSCTVRSRWPRATAWAALGAIEVLSVDPVHRGARALIEASVATLGRPEYGDEWRWPERRLTYANPVLAEALMAVGAELGDDGLLREGLRRLAWLLEMETRDGHLSVTPVGGRDQRDGSARFDQQPIEVAALGDACARAYDLTGDVTWVDGIDRAVRWFTGHNDVGSVMFDPRSGGGYDGLTESGPNLNQGAESTIALLTTLQHGRRLALSVS